LAPESGPRAGEAAPSLPLALLEAIRTLVATAPRRPVLALNGPVGAGKSTLALQLVAQAASRGLRLTVASIDDLYLPLPERRTRLAGNPFGVTRVPPGSHDVPLLLKRLEAWRAGDALRLPRFDKTLAAGEGDRSAESLQQADALLLEGWLMGCRALGEEQLAARLPAALASWPLSEAERSWLPRWDLALVSYAPLWAACDGLWVLRPCRWSLPRRWRFQAEARQRRSGGGWLSAAALDAMVRSSLHALPPPLYQDPLVEGWSGDDSGRLPLLGVTVLDGRRRPLGPPGDHSSPSSASSAIG
jgi:D-glycerate 3-kinase